MADWVVDRSFAAPQSGANGLAWDGASLWVGARSVPRTIYEVDPSDGSTISSFGAPGTTVDVQGLTWDGTHLRVSNNNENLIYRVTTAGVSVSSIPSPGGDIPADLGWDGTYVWVADRGAVGDEFVYQINASTGAVVDSWGAGDTPWGLDYFGGEVWVAQTSSDALQRRAAADGSIVESWDFTSDGITNIRGLAWEDASHLWVIDADDNVIYRLAFRARPTGILVGSVAA